MQAHQFASAIDRVNFTKNYAGKFLFFVKTKWTFFLSVHMVCHIAINNQGNILILKTRNMCSLKA